MAGILPMAMLGLTVVFCQAAPTTVGSLDIAQSHQA